MSEFARLAWQLKQVHEPSAPPRIAGIEHYSYKQRGIGVHRHRRGRRYNLIVTEDSAGRRTAITKRYDPESGVPEARGVPEKRVQLPPLPKTIIVCALLVCASLMVILSALVPFGGWLTIPLTWWLLPVALERVERMRFQVEKVGSDHDLRPVHTDHSVQPRLLSKDELDARLLHLCQPDEDRTYDEPAPIAIPSVLRHPAWRQWARQREDAVMPIAPRNLPQAIDIEQALAQVEDLRERLRYLPKSEADGIRVTLDETERTLRAKLDRLRPDPPEGTVDDVDEPRLERSFKAETDCAEGHNGLHFAGDTFTDDQNRLRIQRSCRWCPSAWSDLV